MKRKIFATLNILAVIAVCLANRRYILEGTLRYKGEASLCFVIVGAVNLVYALVQRSKLLYPTAMVAGLGFAMAGDILLGSSFVLGAALFGIGHLLYFVCYCILHRPRRADLCPVAMVFALSAVLVNLPMFRYDPPFFRWVCMAYALVISLMVGKALSNLLRHRTLLSAVVLFGSVLFYFSDLMLIFDWFAGLDTGLYCLATYYPAQALLGLSAFFHVAKETRS